MEINSGGVLIVNFGCKLDIICSIVITTVGHSSCKYSTCQTHGIAGVYSLVCLVLEPNFKRTSGMINSYMPRS